MMFMKLSKGVMNPYIYLIEQLSLFRVMCIIHSSGAVFQFRVYSVLVSGMIVTEIVSSPNQATIN